MSVTVLSDEVRQNTVLMAKLAEQSERYDDMVEHMQKIARTGSLQMDERNLLSVAYKVGVVAAERLTGYYCCCSAAAAAAVVVTANRVCV